MMADAGWDSWGAPSLSSATSTTAHASAASSSGAGGIGWDDDPAPNVGQNTQASIPAIPTPASNNRWITSADAVKSTASTVTSTNNNNVNNNYVIPPPTSVPPSTILPESQGWVAPPPSFQASNPSNGGAMDGNTSIAYGESSSSSSSSWGNGGGGGNNAFGQERRAPPVYVFTIPNECKGYVIGSGGANLHRIQEETGLRVTQGRPKADSADPSERDFLIFNDENLPDEKAELALIRVVSLVRKKLRDWLPCEGKAGEDAKRLLSEGKFQDSNNGGYGSRNGNGSSLGNGYNGIMQNGPSSDGYGSQGGSWGQAIGNASNANAAPSSPIDTFPTQAGPFKDPNSPVAIPSNWGGLPPPTFSPGPRSNVSHHSNGRAAAQHNSNMNSGIPSNAYERPSNSRTSQFNDRLSSNTGMNQWKPTAPSFVPRTQAAHPVVQPNEPKMDFNTFMKGSAGSQWAFENLPPSSTTSSPQQVTAPQSLQQPTVNTSGGPVVGNEVSYQDSAALAAALGWKVVKPARSVIATSANDIVPPVIPPPPAFDAPSKLPARETTPRPGAQQQQQQQQNGWSAAPSSQASAFNNGPSAGHQGYSAASASPHERNPTHDSGFSQTYGVSTSQVGSNINGWTVKSVPAQEEADPIAPLSAAMSTMQVSGTSSGWNTSSNAQPGQDPASSSSGGIGWGDEPSSASISAVEIEPVATQSSGEGGIGWDDEPSSNSQAAKPQTGSWELPNASNGPSQQNGNNGYSSSKSSTFEDATETIRPSDSISNVNGGSRSVANGYTNGYDSQSHGNGYSNGQLNGYGNHQPKSNGSNGYNSNSHSNNNANGSYGGNGGFSSNYNASGDDGYNSGSGGYSSGGGGGLGGAGSYGGGGPPQERRFPGPGGSWASGANEVPLRQNRWTLHANRRPGDDIHRPVVPQAIPGSGW